MDEESEKKAIIQVFHEILTLLTKKDTAGKRWVDNLPTEHIHKYIQDLDILHKLKSSYEGKDRNS